MLSQRELLQFHRKDRPKRDRIKHKTPGGKRRVFRQRNDWIKSVLLPIVLGPRTESLLMFERRFCEETFGLLVDHDNPYKDNPPHVNQIELFLRWNARRKKGTLSDTGKISVRTLQNDWDYLRRDIKDLTGFRYSDVDLLELETVWQGMCVQIVGSTNPSSGDCKRPALGGKPDHRRKSETACGWSYSDRPTSFPLV